MRKIIVLCLLLSTLGVRADGASARKYGEFLIAHRGMVYELSYMGIPVLCGNYSFVKNDELRMFVMYNETEVVVFYAFTQAPVFRHEFNMPQENLPFIIFEKDEETEGRYDLKILPDNSPEIVVGTFCVIDGCTYRYGLTPL